MNPSAFDLLMSVELEAPVVDVAQLLADPGGAAPAARGAPETAAAA